MPGPLERWLETFMCGQFADNFERYGYRTLQTVCQMQLPQLLSIGIPHKESEIILQNVQILRQSTAAVAQQQSQHGISSNYSNTMSHDPANGASFQNRDVLQEHMNYMGTDSSCFNYGNQISSLSGQFYNQGVAQSLDPTMSSSYRQQYQGSSFPQQLSDGAQFSSLGMPSPSSSSTSGASHGASHHAFQGQVPGSPLMGQTNMRHSHPHLRNSGQSPQEVANNILHMAASSYPTNNTVQVPLSKNRSAPYHMPSRSPNYNSKIQDNQQLMCSDYNQGQFAYPSPPHQSQLHMQSRDQRMSPISPASMISSPHSHHSGRNVPSSSPCSMHSPNKGLVRSPGPNSQLINSPQRGQYQMLSPMNTSNQRMISPIPSSQQLKVSVPSSLSQPYQQCYYGNMLSTSQYSNFQQPMSVQFSPSSISQPSPDSHAGNFHAQSPGGHSGHFSNISSPYTPGSGNYNSPGQQHNSPSVSQPITDRSLTNSPSLKQCNSPLQSLQKLCMLPEVQVVDPKTVVSEASTSSQCGYSEEKPAENNLSMQTTSNAPLNSNFSSTFNGLTPLYLEAELNERYSKADVGPDATFQHEKVMLLKEAKEDQSSSQNEDTAQYCTIRSEDDDTKDSNTKTNDNIEDKTKSPTFVESEKYNETISDNFDNNRTLLKGDQNIGHGSSKDQTNAESYISGSSKDCEDVGNKNVSNEGGKEGEHDSSQSKRTCDSGSEKGADSTDNVELNSADIEPGAKVQSKDEEMAFESEGSLSENESQLVVCKDVKKTYSKQDILKSFEISPRLRGDSTGSLSDDRENSDYEYEDHIGCDDIETGFSDIDSKSNEMIEESVDDAKELENELNNGNVMIDRVMITGTTWKKNGIKNSVCAGQKQRKNGHMKRERFMQSVSDSDDVPSPLGGDVVDGLEDPISVDNGDGTVSVRRPSHIRQRKTPVKYKDTSFFQGDFVFIDGKDDYTYEPKKKIARKSMNVNNKAKQNSVMNKSDKNGNSNLDDSIKEKNTIKQKEKSSAEGVSKNFEKTMKLLAKQNDKVEGEKVNSQVNNIKVLTRGKDGKFKEVKTVTIVKGIPKDDLLKNSGFKKITVNQLPKSDSKHTPCLTATVMTRKSSKQECNIEKNENVKRKVTRKHINGVKTDSVDSEKNVNDRICTDSRLVVNQTNEKTSKTKKSKTSVREAAKTEEEIEVIEIDSDDSECAGNDTGADVSKILEDEKTVPKSNIVNVASQNKVNVDEDKGFMFSLVEDKEVDKKLIEGIQTDLKEKIEENGEMFIEQETSVKKFNKKVSSRSNARTKNSSYRTKANKVVKRKHFTDDPDFEIGANKRPCKTNKFEKNTDISGSKKSKKKLDKWSNFKGPKVIFEGLKQTPKHCVVINDPYEETASKKTKTLTQNLTRIEISQLPSDKSVLIPNNDIAEADQWTCALCGKHSSYKFLGDLFGPYTVETMSDDMLELSPKVRLGTKKKKAEESSNKVGKSGRRSGSVAQEASEWKEVWVHESCSVYSDGVFLIGSKIYGLQEAVRIASQTPCSVCNEMGAMIGCLNKGCQQKFHHACAQGAECYLDEENFSLLCPKHKVKKLKQLEEASTSSSVG